MEILEFCRFLFFDRLFYRRVLWLGTLVTLCYGEDAMENGECKMSNEALPKFVTDLVSRSTNIDREGVLTVVVNKVTLGWSTPRRTPVIVNGERLSAVDLKSWRWTTRAGKFGVANSSIEATRAILNEEGVAA